MREKYVLISGEATSLWMYCPLYKVCVRVCVCVCGGGGGGGGGGDDAYSDTER